MGNRAITEPLALTTDYVSLDARYTDANGNPYASVVAAETALGRRMNQYTVGLKVLVKESGWTEAKEYWVQPKGTTPETYGLVKKGGEDLTKALSLSGEQKHNASANINDRAADVAPVTNEVKALGYKVLNPTLSFAEQVENVVENETVIVDNSNTIFEIRDEFDLESGSVTIPANCTLKFNGGKLSNGTISGTNTAIDGKPLFKEITFAGSYVCKRVFSKDFEYATDDDALTAVFQFLNCIKKDVVCELESKTYDIDYESSLSGNTLFSKWKLNNCSNITINGNGAVLNHTNPLTDIPAGLAQLNSILKLNSCTYITIKELTYQNLNEYDTNYKKDSGSIDGIYVIFFEGNNSFLDISMTAKNAETALGNHIYAPAQTNHIGLVSDSVFNVKQYHTGYGVTFSWIANSKINVEGHGVHRGVYLTGANNCDVYLEWEDQWSAPISCLIGNSWTGGSDNLVWHSCKDLNIVSVCTQETPNADDIGTDEVPGVKKYCVGLGNETNPRTIGLTMQNINIIARSTHGLGGGFLASLESAPSSDTSVKDYYINFRITTRNDYSRFEFHENRVIQNFIVENSRITEGFYANFNTSKLIFTDSYAKNAVIGKGKYAFINTDIANLLDFSGLSSITNTSIYFDNGFVTGTSNSIKATITSSMLPYKATYFWALTALSTGTNCDVSRVMMPNYREKALNYGKLLIQTSNNGTSANRPSNAEDLKVGVMYFDTTLKKPIWYNGTAWVDANGETVGLQVSDTSVLIADSQKTVSVYYSGTTAPTITVLNSDDSANTWLTAALVNNTLTLTAAANNTSAPRGAKVLVTLGDELVIINVIQTQQISNE